MTGTSEAATWRSAYIVLSHGPWQPARRLARAIADASEHARVLVWHDERAVAEQAPRDEDRIVFRSHGFATDWGSWELVEASLSAFSQARELFDPDLLTLVSNSDYPVRPLDRWEQEALATGSWIGSAAPLEYRPRWGRRGGSGDDRATRYSYRWFRLPWSRHETEAPPATWSNRLRDGILRRIEPVLSVRVVVRGRGRFYGVRRIPPPFSRDRPCQIGSQWVALPRADLDELLALYNAPHSQLRRIYRTSIIPDESAIVTPLTWRSPPAHLPPVTFVEWDPHLDQPRLLTLSDLDAVVASGSPFARKMDPVVSAPLLDALDRRLSAAGQEAVDDATPLPDERTPTTE